MERVYSKCPLVQNLLVYGNSFKSYAVAVVIPEEEVVMALAKQSGWEGDFKAICEKNELKAAIQQQMQKQAEKEGLNSLEQIKGNFKVSATPWLAVPVQILTSTQKLRRHIAQDYYMPLFNELYEQDK